MHRPGRLKRIDLGEIGTLFIRSVRPKSPNWTRFFEGVVDVKEFGRSATPAAVLVTECDGDWFALPFGSGRFLLDSARIELSFGLDVAKNLVGAQRIRSVDKFRLDRAGTASRVQTARESPPSEFSIDYDQELLRAIAGAPDGGRPGEVVSGVDVLRVSARTSLSELAQLLRGYAKAARSRRYRTVFAGMDQISPVRDADRKTELTDVLLDQLYSGEVENLTIAPPDIVDWTEIRGFRFGAQSREYPELRIETVIEQFAARGGRARGALERLRISAIRPDDSTAHAWPALRCLYAEVSHKGRLYILNGGAWYSIAASFIEEVNESMGRVPVVALGLPDYAHRHEGEYNEAAGRAGRGRLFLLDKKLVHCRAAQGGIELCDLYSVDRDLIHVKRAGGSCVYSHWFNQGVVSAKLLKHDREFRSRASELLVESGCDGIPAGELQASEYRIVWAAIGGPKAPTRLPLFSRVTLRLAAQDLQAIGYGVAYAYIGVSEEHARRVMVRATSPRRRVA